MILRICDLETTGFAPPAEVCEVAYCDLLPILGTNEYGVNHHTYSRLCGVSAMPPEVRAVHHITLAEVEGKEPFSREDVIAPHEKIVLVAHNANFERLWIDAGDTPWICTYKSALRVWPDAPSHSNSVLRYWLEDQGLLSLDHDRAMPPHRAGPDAYVTAHILLALLKLATVEEIIKWTGEPRLLPRIPMGKHKGKKWAEIDRGYLEWVTKQTDMDADIVWNARREIDRRIQEDLDIPF